MDIGLFYFVALRIKPLKDKIMFYVLSSHQSKPHKMDCERFKRKANIENNFSASSAAV